MFRKKTLLSVLVTLLASSGVLSLSAAPMSGPTPDEMAEARRWAAAKFAGIPEPKDAEPFFSFTYDGKPSSDLLKAWESAEVRALASPG